MLPEVCLSTDAWVATARLLAWCITRPSTCSASSRLACWSPEPPTLRSCQSFLLCCSLVNLEYFAASTNLNVCGTVATLGNYSAGVNPLSYSLGSCARSVAG